MKIKNPGGHLNSTKVRLNFTKTFIDTLNMFHHNTCLQPLISIWRSNAMLVYLPTLPQESEREDEEDEPSWLPHGPQLPVQSITINTFAVPNTVEQFWRILDFSFLILEDGVEGFSSLPYCPQCQLYKSIPSINSIMTYSRFKFLDSRIRGRWPFMPPPEVPVFHWFQFVL